MRERSVSWNTKKNTAAAVAVTIILIHTTILTGKVIADAVTSILTSTNITSIPTEKIRAVAATIIRMNILTRKGIAAAGMTIHTNTNILTSTGLSIPTNILTSILMSTATVVAAKRNIRRTTTAATRICCTTKKTLPTS